MLVVHFFAISAATVGADSIAAFASITMLLFSRQGVFYSHTLFISQQIQFALWYKVMPDVFFLQTLIRFNQLFNINFIRTIIISSFLKSEVGKQPWINSSSVTFFIGKFCLYSRLYYYIFRHFR
jgi:hypothetical protein